MGLRSDDQALGSYRVKIYGRELMIKIADLLDRDFSTPIEEIIKVNNADEDTVHTELTEYVATPRIKDEYQRLFQAMAAAPIFTE